MDRPNSVEAYATILMRIDNQVLGRNAEQQAIRNKMGQFTAPIVVAHPSQTTGGLAPMDLFDLRTRPAQRPAAEQRYIFLGGDGTTISVCTAPTPAMSSSTALLPIVCMGTNRL
ncbi:uncharacterized protein H6S33_012253 [Morchella sextelata]|uniref:uncharacterized protein n=1 Tax=Morchella sextelata TaxID=1174677 RepID=UPI001D03C3F2|nr:uncharacterized protein H6S33_012253 [Morchella sextelata]KAH0609707.1 hypothetical protein H6S33_012253 [Morchella sextelata]